MAVHIDEMVVNDRATAPDASPANAPGSAVAAAPTDHFDRRVEEFRAQLRLARRWAD